MTTQEHQAAHRLARYYLAPHRDSRDFDDLVAEVVLAAWEKHTRDQGRYSLRTYLKYAARYKPIEWFRSARSGRLVDGYYQERYRVESYEALLTDHEREERATPSPEPHAPDFAPCIVDQVTLARFLDRLTVREQLILSLTYREGLTAREVGERMGSTKGAIVQAIRKSLERLKQRMGNEPEEYS